MSPIYFRRASRWSLLHLSAARRPISPCSTSSADSPDVAQFVRHQEGHGDDVRSALLIEFYGGCYTLLTEWSPVHVMNDLMEGIRQEGGLRTVAAADLSIDDFVLFRAGGDEEFIRLLQRDELGAEEYERVRAIAERWKSAIRRLGRTPQEVQRRLRREWPVPNAPNDCRMDGKSRSHRSGRTMVILRS